MKLILILLLLSSCCLKLKIVSNDNGYTYAKGSGYLWRAKLKDTLKVGKVIRAKPSYDSVSDFVFKPVK